MSGVEPEMIIIGGSIGYGAVPDDFNIGDIINPPSVLERRVPDIEAVLEAYITEQDVVQRVEITSPGANLSRRPPTATDRLAVDSHRVASVLFHHRMDLETFVKLLDMALWAIEYWNASDAEMEKVSKMLDTLDPDGSIRNK